MVRVFKLAQMARSVPYKDTRRGFPEALQGIFWLDVDGYYGCKGVHTAVHGSSGYGQIFTRGLLDLKTRVSTMDNRGRIRANSWGRTWKRLLHGARGFSIQWNEDYTKGFIKNYFDIWHWRYGERGVAALNTWGTEMTIEKQTPPSSCPAPEEASCSEKSACAAWIRKDFFGPSMLGMYKAGYYVFQLVDGHGRKMQPYFDKFEELMRSRYSEVSSKEHLQDIRAQLTVGGEKIGTSGTAVWQKKGRKARPNESEKES